MTRRLPYLVTAGALIMAMTAGPALGATAPSTGGAVPTAAQAPVGPAPVLTLDQVVQRALSQNPQIASAEEAVTAAQQNVVVARTGLAPTISATGSGSFGTSTSAAFGSATGQPGGVFGSPSAAGSVTLGASLPLFDSGKTRVAVEQANAQLAQAEATLRQTEQDLALQAATAFFTVLKDERLADVQAQQLAQAQAVLAQTQTQVKVGVAAQADVIQAQAQVALAEVNVLSSRSQIATAKAALQTSIAADTASPVEVQAPTPPPVQVGVTAEAALQAALANRPEIVRAQAVVQSGQAGVAQAYQVAGPQVDVNAGTGYTPFSTNGGVANTASYGLTATVALPLFDAGKGKAEINAAQANLRSSQAQLNSTILTIRQDAYQAYLVAVQAAANLTATQTAAAAAQNALSVAQGRYRAGIGTILEVTTAFTTATQAEVNYTSAVYDYQTALATLRHAQGQPIIPIAASTQGGQP
jgi:outer membrane protein